MDEDLVALGLYVAGMMDAHRIEGKKVAALSGEAPATVSRLRTGSRRVNRSQICQIIFAAGRAFEQNRQQARKAA